VILVTTGKKPEAVRHVDDREEDDIVVDVVAVLVRESLLLGLVALLPELMLMQYLLLRKLRYEMLLVEIFVLKKLK
jgi:hypothetical protein